MNKVWMAAALAATATACMRDVRPPPPTGDDASASHADSAVADAGPAPDALVMDTAIIDVAAADRPTPDAMTIEVPVHGDAAGGAADGDAADGDTADGGAATCGPAAREMLCTTYCQGMAKFCSGQFATAAACAATCNGPGWACGEQGDLTGSSLFCRLAHLALAGVGSAAKECPNAGPDSPACR
jgi:hypothetical protein